MREGRIVFASPSQQHFFDCPYQLGDESTDTPADAELLSVGVQEGDILVIGSDGLWDNTFDKEISELVRSRLAQVKDVQCKHLFPDGQLSFWTLIMECVHAGYAIYLLGRGWQ